MNIKFFKKAKNVLLEAEVNPKQMDAFKSRYEGITGEPISEGNHLQSQPGKWGTECRIYYDGPDLSDEFNELGINVEIRNSGYGSDRPYRVNNVEFFWALIEAGYRLGEN